MTGLDRAVALLRCPVCRAGSLERPAAGRQLRCSAGHAFDVARQGFVTLSRKPIRHPGDTADMVAARERVLSAGLFAPLSQALVEAAGDAWRTAVDLGAGTGHHLAVLLDAVPQATGVAIDSSKPALRRAARAHDRLAAVGADLTAPLPLVDGAADLAAVVFAPRPAAELARIVAPGGRLFVVVPDVAHLAALRAELGMLDIPDDKVAAVGDALASGFRLEGHHEVAWSSRLTPTKIRDLVAMGPTAFHLDRDEIAARVSRMEAPREVRMQVHLLVLRRA